MTTSKRWFWLCFAENGFRGVVVIEAFDFLDAVAGTHLLGINPGGGVAGWEVPGVLLAIIHENCRNRLLSLTEVEAHYASCGTLSTMGESGPPQYLPKPFCQGRRKDKESQ